VAGVRRRCTPSSETEVFVGIEVVAEEELAGKVPTGRSYIFRPDQTARTWLTLVLTFGEKPTYL
jgi:hypothetical protein